jgi:hypothetical protein
MKIVKAHESRSAAHGSNLFTVLPILVVTYELLSDGDIVLSTGLDVEEWERCWILTFHKVLKRAHEDMIGLRHQNVILFNDYLLCPLKKRVWPVEDLYTHECSLFHD